jgi:hypothetical protein
MEYGIGGRYDIPPPNGHTRSFGSGGYNAGITCIYIYIYIPVPTQFKATQLVVAIAVWAIPGGLSMTYRLYFINITIG